MNPNDYQYNPQAQQSADGQYDGSYDQDGGYYEEAAPPPPVKKKNPFAVWWDKVGGGSLTVSIIVHAIFLLIAFIYIVNVISQEKKVDFLPGGSAPGAKASSDMQNKVSSKRKTSMKANVPLRKITTSSASASIALPEMAPEVVDVPEMAMPNAGFSGAGSFGAGGGGGGGGGSGGMGGGTGLGVGSGNMSNFVAMPDAMKARCSPGERLEKLRKNGGDPKCEVAVVKALNWLQTKQNPDGSWGRTHKCGMTGLALLAYLGHCESNDSVLYGDTVSKAIAYLVGVSQKNNGFLSENLTAHANTYEHGIACYGLGEMYAFAKIGKKPIPGMREAFEKGVDMILENQLADGGWGYNLEAGGYRKTGSADLSVTGWQFQALKAAKNTRLTIGKLAGATRKVEELIEKRQNPTGGFGVLDRKAAYNQWTMSALCVLGLQTIGKGNTKRINDGIDFLTKEYTAKPPVYDSHAGLYVWYYDQQAFFQKGGDSWRFWNEQVQKQMLDNQNADGSWKPERGYEHGTSSQAGNDADIFRTAAATLMLEVYYRYLQVGSKEESSIFDRPAASAN